MSDGVKTRRDGHILEVTLERVRIWWFYRTNRKLGIE